MHPLLADWRRGAAYFFAWALVGSLIAAQLVLAAPFGWVEALAFAIPLSLLFGFVGLGTLWVCQAAPLQLSQVVRSLGTQLVAALVSAALWLAAARGWAAILERLDEFIGGIVEQMDHARTLLLVTSDHGNIEDLSTRRHTDAKVPGLVIGSKAAREKFVDGLTDLTGIAPAIKTIINLQSA